MNHEEPAGPRVTIITPTLNQANFIEATLRSVAEQDYPRIEHIVIDGGSTDGTLDILRAWGGRWISEPDRGQADAINKGLAMSTGDIFAWLNSDDVYLSPTVISQVVAAFVDGAAMVTAGGRYIDAEGRATEEIPVRPDRLDQRHLRHVDELLQPATFVRRELMLPLDPSLHWAMDWDLFVRLADRGTFMPLDAAVAGYRLHGSGKTETGGSRRQMELARVAARYSGKRSPVYLGALWLAAVYRLSEAMPGRMGWLVHGVANESAVRANRLLRGYGVPY